MADPIARYERDIAKRFPAGSAALMRGALHRASLERADLLRMNGVCDDGEEVVWCRPPPDALFAFASRRSIVVATRERPGALDLDEALVLEAARRDPRNAQAHCHAGTPRLADATLETRSSWLVFGAPETTVELLVGARATKAPPPSARVVRAGKVTLMGTLVARATVGARGWELVDLGGVSASARAALHLIVGGEVVAEGIAAVSALGGEDESSVLAALLDGLMDSSADAMGPLEPLALSREGERIVWRYLWRGAPDQHSVYWPTSVSRRDVPALRKALTRGVPSDD